MKEFIEAYEIIDPEPPLRWSDGTISSHYHWPDVVAHIQWHSRMTAYYLKNVAGSMHFDNE